MSSEALAENALDSNPEAVLALALMSQDWKTIGLSDDPQTAATSDTDIMIDRLVAIMTVRLAAIAAPLGTFPDLSVVSICMTVLRTGEPWPLTASVQAQLREFVSRILKGYKANHYHSQEHCSHVTLSACKLLDMVLNVPVVSVSHNKPPPSFGLRHDPLLLFVVVFSALCHDVEHQGLPNRQLAVEKDRLAILYNDQSIAENWSLYVAFSELLQDDFDELRQVLCTYVAPLDVAPTTAVIDATSQHSHSQSQQSMSTAATMTASPPTPDELYNKFRKHVVNLVLCTDIASPDRTQLGKSKWKEAFGDPYETVERKVRLEMRRASIGMTGKIIGGGGGNGRNTSNSNRRGSNFSELSFGAGPVNAPVTGAANTNMLPADDHENDDEDSLSLTPEHSDDDLDDARPKPMPQAPPPHAARKASMGYGPGAPSRFERRMSTTSKSSLQSARFRQRLGIRRSMDLSGETIEHYQRNPSLGQPINTSCEAGTFYSFDIDSDLPDELKATVVMEAIMTASDVAHNLQGFKQMEKWSNKLYLELRKAYVAKRGFDCSPKWFENQIGFLESYLLPLARKLEDTGVFGEGTEFARNVEQNRDLWLMRGMEIAEQIVKEGLDLYPEPEDNEE